MGIATKLLVGIGLYLIAINIGVADLPSSPHFLHLYGLRGRFDVAAVADVADGTGI